jgi:hypothetical protein
VLCRQILSKMVTQILVLVSRNGELENRPFLELTIQISTQKMEANSVTVNNTTV